METSADLADKAYYDGDFSRAAFHSGNECAYKDVIAQIEDMEDEQ